MKNLLRIQGLLLQKLAMVCVLERPDTRPCPMDTQTPKLDNSSLPLSHLPFLLKWEGRGQGTRFKRMTQSQDMTN